jgi:hypothetical protein
MTHQPIGFGTIDTNLARHIFRGTKFARGCTFVGRGAGRGRKSFARSAAWLGTKWVQQTKAPSSASDYVECDMKL